MWLVYVHSDMFSFFIHFVVYFYFEVSLLEAIFFKDSLDSW